MCALNSTSAGLAGVRGVQIACFGLTIDRCAPPESAFRHSACNLGTTSPCSPPVGAGGYGQPILTGIRLDDLGLILEGAIPAAVLALIVQAGLR